MTPERWQQIKEVFQAALDVPRHDRTDYIAAACGSDADLRRQVEKMLGTAPEDDDSLLDTPMADVGARLLHRETQHFGGVSLGQRLGRHRLVRELGRGGMGTVYLAEREDGEYRERVAIKLVQRGLEADDAWIRRFRQERQILADLDHPNIARLLDGGVSDDGRPYLVMEYIDGRPLDRYCEAERLSQAERLRLVHTICMAVQAAHRSLVAHCDLKPSNVLITGDGRVKLVDFGIARLLRPDDDTAGLTVTRDSRPRTPEYASPEQIHGRPLTTATDVFSLGVLLYELLVGSHPFAKPEQSRHDLERRICEDEPAPPHLGRDLDTILWRALGKTPRERYGSVEQLANDVARHLDGRPVLARPQTVRYRLGKYLRRHYVGASAAFLVLLSLVTGALVATWQAQEALAQQRTTRRALEFLVGVFEVPDPEESGPRRPTFEGVLAAGAENLSALDDEPEAQALMMDTIGQVYRKLGEYERAEPLLTRALELRQAGAPPSDVARSLANVGVLRLRQGDYDAAEERLVPSLELARRVWGEDGETTLIIRNSLALLRKTRGDVGGAETLYRESLDRGRKTLGEDHRLVASTLNNLAVLLRQQGRLEEAEGLYRQVLKIRKRLFGEVHLRVASSLSNLGVLLRQRRRFDEAASLQREALAIQQELLGDKHPEIATTLTNLASSLHAVGEKAEAEALFRRALTMQEALLGEEHPQVAVTLSNLAVVLQRQGRQDEAEKAFRQVLRRQRKSLGDDHLRVADTRINLAVLLRSPGQDGEAENLLRRAVESYREQAGDHPNHAWGLTELGRLLLDRGAATEAEAPLRQALEIRRLGGAPSSKLAQSESLLGSCVLALGRPDEARPLLASGLAGLEASLGEDHPRSLKARQAVQELERCCGADS